VAVGILIGWIDRSGARATCSIRRLRTRRWSWCRCGRWCSRRRLARSIRRGGAAFPGEVDLAVVEAFAYGWLEVGRVEPDTAGAPVERLAGGRSHRGTDRGEQPTGGVGEL